MTFCAILDGESQRFGDGGGDAFPVFGMDRLLLSDDRSKALLAFEHSAPGWPATIGQRVMTPKHASPEQLLGERITTASDVYALGVLLYELLSGSFPFAISSSSVADVEQIVTKIDPPAPSNAAVRPVASSIGKAVQLDASGSAARRRLSTAQLVRRLRGDLDSITLKAINRQPVVILQRIIDGAAVGGVTAPARHRRHGGRCRCRDCGIHGVPAEVPRRIAGYAPGNQPRVASPW